jgi:hypothetical protein
MKNKHGSGFKAQTWFVAALLATFATGCGDGIFGGGGGGPSALVVIPGPGTCLAAVGFPQIPQVNSSVPASGAAGVATSTTGVAPSKLITATFSIPMTAATIDSAVPGALLTFTLTGAAGANVPGTVLLNGAGTMATFTTTAALAPGTPHTATITTAAMSAGAPNTALACIYTWQFTTGPIATGLAPINMGLAAPFGIASTAGVTDTLVAPITHIEGDVILANPTPECNFVAAAGGAGTAGFGLCGSNGSTPTLNGTVVTPTVPDAFTAAAVKADLNAAFLSTCAPGVPDAACTQPPGIIIGAAAAGIGGGVGAPCVFNINAGNCFTPGTYTAASSITITGDLTLDALGDPDAVFIFQAGSTVGLAAGAAPPGARTRILLTGGAKASNVWWSAGSSATIGTFAESQGNILAAFDITIDTNATSCGRLMSGAWVGGSGRIDFSGNVVSVPGNPFTPPATYSAICQ